MAKSIAHLDPTAQKNIDAWLTGAYDEETKSCVRRLLAENPQAAADAFYTSLEFGTGGMRGVMGVGTNRINIYTIRFATQGLASYLLEQPGIDKRVLIGFDPRHNSSLFAHEAARVLAANGISVSLFRKLRPTPLVSFGCRHLKCNAAIMITASHNPPEYNGYKVYWSHGGQVLPPHDQKIVEAANKITDIAQVKVAPLDHPLISWIDDELDHAYLEATRPLQCYPEQNQRYGSTLKVVYTNLHGAGITMVPKSMRDWGFTQIVDVNAQKEPNGDFPTVSSPNPEERAALQMGIDTLQMVQGDLLLGTDPDTDRVGIAVRHQDEIVLLDGNQIACVCLAHVCEALHQQKRLPEKAAFIKTIVTTELFQEIAHAYQRSCFNVLTGFKYIGELIEGWSLNKEDYQFIFGGEESYGYLLGTHVRDKDAIIISSLICEVALHAKRQGRTIIDLLHDLYHQYGIYREKLLSVTAKGKEGMERIQKMMSTLRTNPPQAFSNIPIIAIEDYFSSKSISLPSGISTPLLLPKSDVILYRLKDGSKLVIRPSGTEPKIKFYCGVVQKEFADLKNSIDVCDQRAEQLLNELQLLLA